MTRVLLVVPLFVAFFLVAPAPAAHACSCAMFSTGQQVEDADLVVRGTIVGTEDPEGSLATISSARPVTHEVAVTEVYKGDAAATIFVGSAAEGASCGIEVETGREYVLFAREEDGAGLSAGFCDGTRPVSDELVAEVEALTGPGRPVKGATGGTTSATPSVASSSTTTPPTTTPSTTTAVAAPGVPGQTAGPSALPWGLGLGAVLVASVLGAVAWRRPRRGGEAATPAAG